MGLKDKLGRVGILMGGPSSEREISLKSGKAVYENLKRFGLDVVSIDIKNDDKQESIRLIKSSQINCAFVALHGHFGEDGQLQKILDTFKIPYTGSGVQASRLAMDKSASRRIFKKHGLNVPNYKVLDKAAYNTHHKIYNHLSLPWVIKPATQGSSIGLSIVDTKEELNNALDLAFRFDKRIIIEEFIKGREITVGILDERVLPTIEIVPKRRFFDYAAKYQPGMTDYIVPAKLDKKVLKTIEKIALSAHKLLGCSGCSRVDMILNQNNIPFILEVNTIPGLTETSLLPKAAKNRGVDFTQLCLKLIQLAYEKTRV